MAPVNPVTITSICIFKNGKDVCHGDSGSPLMWSKSDRTHVVGVASKSYLCMTKKPAIYEATSPASDWIKKTVGSFCK